MPSVAFSYCYADCHYGECRYAECRYAKYVGAIMECHRAELPDSYTTKVFLARMSTFSEFGISSFRR